MATKAETRDRAATDLGILRLNQSLQHQDKVRVEAGYDEVHADLKEEGLATWALTGSVPTKLVPHVVNLIVLNCSGTYPLSVERMERLLLKTGQNGELAKREIRKLITPDHESLEEPSDY